MCSPTRAGSSQWGQFAWPQCPWEHHLPMSPGRAARSLWCQRPWPLDETLAAKWNSGWHIPMALAAPATGRALQAEDGHSSSQVSVMWM